MSKMINFQTEPGEYRHWRVEYDGPVARLIMDVDEQGWLFECYELKLNSYDLGVDIELADIVQRLRFEHPVTGKELRLSAPLPEHMARTWEMLGWREADCPEDIFEV